MTEDEHDKLDAEAALEAEAEWPAEAAPGPNERPLTDEERAALLREELKALRVAEVAHDMMLSLVTLGYQKLGLTDETRELRNLEDARLAIELLRGVIGALGAVAGEQLVAPFRSTLAAMQMSFARVASPASATEAEPKQAEGGDSSAAQDSAADEPEASDRDV